MSSTQEQPYFPLVARPLLSLLMLSLLLPACGQNYSVSINDQSIYDPTGRSISGEVSDSDLQGCINLAVQQQGVQDPAELTVLTCANSRIRALDNIGRLGRLRFLDLGNNNISNITPLEDLPTLGGLNLANNVITDISPLLNMQSLASVSLFGNNNIPCDQLSALRARLGNNLTAPERCRN